MRIMAVVRARVRALEPETNPLDARKSMITPPKQLVDLLRS
jgi:hypothetical protein